MSERAWRRASLALALPILLLAACGPRTDKPHPDQAAVLAFIDRYFSTWSARDMDGYGSCFHPSARIVFVSHGGGLQADTLTDFLHGQRLAHAQSDQPMTESATDIKQSIRDFAKTYSDRYSTTWRWPGKYNCQTFQEQMMKDLGLSKSNSKNLK